MTSVAGPLPPGAALAPGLEVVEHLRRGADLDAYHAWDEDRGCPVVVKAVRPDRRDDATASARVVREGDLLLGLAHPHLVRAYELRPGPLLVLEVLPGETVGALLDRRGRLPPAEVRVLAAQLASALGHLHRHDLLHLDVKPSNVVNAGGRAVLLDLSVARRAGHAPAGEGTWSSMSPEQVRGGVLGPPCDVFGLGTLLHECLSGENPFEAHEEDHPQLHHRAPPLRARRDRELAALVHAALDPDPAARPPIAAFGALLPR